MGKQCSKCSALLPDTAKFCDKCGAPVQEQPQAQYCPKCGTRLEPGTKFCGSCGTPVKPSSNQRSQQFADRPKDEQQKDSGYATEGTARRMDSSERTKQWTSGTEQQNSTYTNAANNNGYSYSPPMPEAAAPPKKFNTKRIVLIVGLVILIILIVAALGGDGSIDSVKNGTLEDYPDTTVGDALESRFTNGKWSSESNENATYVVFRGHDPTTICDWEVEFKVVDNRFRVESITVDGIYYSDGVSISVLVDYIYTGNYDLLIGYAFLGALFS